MAGAPRDLWCRVSRTVFNALTHLLTLPRVQHPRRFYGLKESLLLRGDPACEPGHTPDWGSWATVERSELQNKAAKKEGAPETFDPVGVGPWMDLWDLEKDVRGLPNQHIDSYLHSDPAARDPQRYIDKGHW